MPSSTGVPSWNDVGAWNAGTPTSTRFSVSFRGDASAAAESTASNAPRPILSLPALEATRSVANTLRAVTDEVAAVKHATMSARSSDTRTTAASSAANTGNTGNTPGTTGDATAHARVASSDSRSSIAELPPTDIALLCRSIDVLTDAVRRLDQHLDRLLDVQSRAAGTADDRLDAEDDAPVPPPLSSTSTRDDHQALERDLDAVLAEVAQVRSEGAPHAELARLRRRQADILARLLALDNHDDIAINLRLVSAESGPALRRRLA